MGDAPRLTDERLVYCVLCIDYLGKEVTHVFSSKEKAQSFASADVERGHIFYDYVIDCPERMEGVLQ